MLPIRISTFKREMIDFINDGDAKKKFSTKLLGIILSRMYTTSLKLWEKEILKVELLVRMAQNPSCQHSIEENVLMPLDMLKWMKTLVTFSTSDQRNKYTSTAIIQSKAITILISINLN